MHMHIHMPTLAHTIHMHMHIHIHIHTHKYIHTHCRRRILVTRCTWDASFAPWCGAGRSHTCLPRLLLNILVTHTRVLCTNRGHASMHCASTYDIACMISPLCPKPSRPRREKKPGHVQQTTFFFLHRRLSERIGSLQMVFLLPCSVARCHAATDCAC